MNEKVMRGVNFFHEVHTKLAPRYHSYWKRGKGNDRQGCSWSLLIQVILALQALSKMFYPKLHYDFHYSIFNFKYGSVLL